MCRKDPWICVCALLEGHVTSTFKENCSYWAVLYVLLFFLGDLKSHVDPVVSKYMFQLIQCVIALRHFFCFIQVG